MGKMKDCFHDHIIRTIAFEISIFIAFLIVLSHFGYLNTNIMVSALSGFISVAVASYSLHVSLQSNEISEESKDISEDALEISEDSKEISKNSDEKMQCIAIDNGLQVLMDLEVVRYDLREIVDNIRDERKYSKQDLSINIWRARTILKRASNLKRFIPDWQKKRIITSIHLYFNWLNNHLDRLKPFEIPRSDGENEKHVKWIYKKIQDFEIYEEYNNPKDLDNGIQKTKDKIIKKLN